MIHRRSARLCLVCFVSAQGAQGKALHSRYRIIAAMVGDVPGLGCGPVLLPPTCRHPGEGAPLAISLAKHWHPTALILTGGVQDQGSR